MIHAIFKAATWKSSKADFFPIYSLSPAAARREKQQQIKTHFRRQSSPLEAIRLKCEERNDCQGMRERKRESPKMQHLPKTWVHFKMYPILRYRVPNFDRAKNSFRKGCSFHSTVPPKSNKLEINSPQPANAHEGQRTTFKEVSSSRDIPLVQK
jgi:hypothetical protein